MEGGAQGQLGPWLPPPSPSLSGGPRHGAYLVNDHRDGGEVCAGEDHVPGHGPLRFRAWGLQDLMLVSARGGRP